MKRLIYILMCIPLLVWVGACTGSQELESLLDAADMQPTDSSIQSRAQLTEKLTVHLDTAGTLAAKLGDTINTVQVLTITGQFNAADLNTLRAMCSTYNDETYSLASINLQGATIVGSDTLTYQANSFNYLLKDNEIGESMFSGLFLSEIILPDNITKIGSNAFYGVHYRQIGGYDFPFTEIEIPETVTAIDESAFMNCSSLKKVILPSKLIKLSPSVFFNCSSLSEINVPDSLTYIMEGAFSGCSSLTAFAIPERVTAINDEIFYGCSSLNNITIPSGVTSIGSYAFADCSSLSNITTFSSNITELKDHAFSGSGLTAIELPSTLTTIGESAFSRCERLTSAVFRGNPTIGDNTFDGCSALTDVTLPSNMTAINPGMFFECDALSTISLPSGLTSIGDNAFYQAGLTQIVLPETLESIGESAFYDCSNLTQIEFPASLKTIGGGAFEYCAGLTEVTIPETVTTIGGAAFYDCQNLATVVYNSKASCSGYNLFALCSNLSNVTLSEGLQDISGSMFNNCKKLKTIEIPSSVTKIADGAFGYTGLTAINISAAITSIGDNAFDGCSDLQTVTFAERTSDETLEGIGEFAFRDCTSLEEIVLPEGLLSIDTYAFSGCTNLKGITIPSTVQSMGYAMLYDTDNLCYIFYNASIPIGNDLFQSYGASDANPNLLIYLSQDVAVNDTYLKNLILNGEAVAITLTSSANAFYAPQAFAAKSISYTQSYTYPTYIGESAGWRSLSLPFSPTTITHSDGRVLAPFNSNVADSKPFWLRRLTSNGFENATSIEANTPYIIAMPNDSIYDEEYRISGDVTFSATNVTVSATPETLTQDTGPEFNLTPIYEVRSASTGIYLLNETATTTYYAGSRFVRNNRSAHPFEAILISNPISASAPAYYRVGGTSSAKTRTTRTADGKPHIDDL